MWYAPAPAGVAAQTVSPTTATPYTTLLGRPLLVCVKTVNLPPLRRVNPCMVASHRSPVAGSSAMLSTTGWLNPSSGP